MLSMATQVHRIQFLSTPSARRATSYTHNAPRVEFISIHALREEGDCCVVAL